MALMQYARRMTCCMYCGEDCQQMVCKDCRNPKKTRMCNSCGGNGHNGGFVCGHCCGEGYT